jgi:hypothetical protein
MTLNNLGNIERSEGNTCRASDLIAEALGMRRRIKDSIGMITSCLAAGGVFCCQGQYRIATVMLFGAEQHRKLLGIELDPDDYLIFHELERTMAAVVASGLVDEAVLSAWKSEARSLRLGDLVEFALLSLPGAFNESQAEVALRPRRLTCCDVR